MSGIGDRIALSSSDPFAALPPDTVLANGQVQVPCRLFLAGSQNISATDVDQPAITPDTSSEVTVVPGAFAGFCIGALVNYLIARRFVFRSERPHAAAMPRFALVAASGAAINTGIVALLNGAGVHYLAAQVAATVVVLGWNLVVNRSWTFTG